MPDLYDVSESREVVLRVLDAINTEKFLILAQCERYFLLVFPLGIVYANLLILAIEEAHPDHVPERRDVAICSYFSHWSHRLEVEHFNLLVLVVGLLEDGRFLIV